MQNFQGQQPPPDEHAPEVTESRKGGRWVPPVVAIVIFVIVLIVLGIYYL